MIHIYMHIYRTLVRHGIYVRLHLCVYIKVYDYCVHICDRQVVLIVHTKSLHVYMHSEYKCMLFWWKRASVNMQTHSI